MNSKDYWHDRETEALQHYITDEEEYSRHIEKIYMNMLDNVQKEINSFYGKYAAAEGITIAEAKKKISKADMDALARDAERYTKAAARDRKLNGGQTDHSAFYFSKDANERMRLYNATMKINRLEMLKANIGKELVKGSAELDEYMTEILQGRTVEELERMAGILGESVKDNAKAAHSIVNASFHNATFSNRIWLYNDVMKADIDKLIQQGMIQGKNARVLAKDLRKYYTGSPKLKNGKNGAIYSAERLMRTELARVQIGAQEASLKANGFDMYQFNVNGGCCPDCEQAAKKDNGYGPGVYLLEDLQYGYNAPPLHPHCRCSISAYSDRKVYDAWFDYMDKTGQEISWQDFKKKHKEAANDPYKNMTFTQKKALIDANQQKIDRLREDKKQAEFDILMASNADEMGAAFKRAKDIQSQIEGLTLENDNIQKALGLPTNAKERFLAQEIDFKKLPHDVKDDEYGAVSSWTRTSYVDMNRYMRYGDKGVNPKAIQEAQTLMQCLDRNIVKEPFTARRGINTKAMDEWFGGESWRKQGFDPNGAIIVDKGFCATTPGKTGGFGGDVMAYIDVPAGAKGAYIADFSGAKQEQEFLLQCNTYFRVDHVEITYDKWNEPHYDVFLRVIVDEK